MKNNIYGIMTPWDIRTTESKSYWSIASLLREEIKIGEFPCKLQNLLMFQEFLQNILLGMMQRTGREIVDISWSQVE